MLKLTKRQINQKIVPHSRKGKRGPSCKVDLLAEYKSPEGEE